MSSVLKRFDGLEDPRAQHSKLEPTYKGIPCLLQAHSGVDFDAPAWRDSQTHACLECATEIKKHKISLNLNRFDHASKLKALSYWSKVDIREPDQCWPWVAPLIKSRLWFTWERREIRNQFRHHPITVGVWLSWGDTGRLGTVSTCGNRRCCNPLHNLPKGLLHERDLFFIDQARFASELSILKSQLNEAIENKLIDNLKPDEPQIYKANDLPEFQQKILEVQASLLSESHTMLSPNKLLK